MITPRYSFVDSKRCRDRIGADEGGRQGVEEGKKLQSLYNEEGPPSCNPVDSFPYTGNFIPSLHASVQIMASSSIEAPPDTETGRYPEGTASTGAAGPEHSTATGTLASFVTSLRRVASPRSSAVRRSYVHVDDQEDQADYEETICGSLLVQFYFRRPGDRGYRLKVTLVPNSPTYRSKLPTAADIADKANGLDPLFQVESNLPGVLTKETRKAWFRIQDYWMRDRDGAWELPQESYDSLKEAVKRGFLVNPSGPLAIDSSVEQLPRKRGWFTDSLRKVLGNR
jgi:hypothetical protein